MKQYSKRIVKHMVSLWFAGAIFGAVVIVDELVAVGCGFAVTVHLPELLNYISIPVSCGVVGYLCKSAFENREKIKQNYMQDYDESHGGISNE